MLDYRRLGQQRRECKQLLGAVTRGGGWANHPAAKMWRGHEAALAAYMTVIVREWVSRGYKNTMQIPHDAEGYPNPDFEYAGVVLPLGATPMPGWLGREDVHASHRGRLLHKNPEHYGQFGWTDRPLTDEDGYCWPV